MNQQQVMPAYRHAPIHIQPSMAELPGQPITIKEERLPFTVRVVKNARELEKAIRIRQSAYSRHVPELGEKLKNAEQLDFDQNTVVILAESKLNGAPLGTTRIQTNTSQPLTVEQSVQLPSHLVGKKLVEITRLGVENAQVGRIVKLALFKACFQYCVHNGIDWMVATGRSPIDRQYAQLMFEDLFPEQGFIPMKHVQNIPHRVMALRVDTALARWTAANHPMLNFFIYTYHPDIYVGQTVSALAPMSCRRTRPAPLLAAI